MVRYVTAVQIRIAGEGLLSATVNWIPPRNEISEITGELLKQVAVNRSKRGGGNEQALSYSNQKRFRIKVGWQFPLLFQEIYSFETHHYYI